MNEIDPDVAAAFGGVSQSPQQSAATNHDPDVIAAFPGSGTNVAPDWLKQSEVKPDQASTPISMLVGEANKWMGGKLVKGAQALGMTDPKSLQMVRDVPAAVEMVAPLALSDLGSMSRGFLEPPENHPLAQAATAEQSSLDTMESTARSQGLELPETSISQPQRVANRLAREDLQLPTQAKHGVDAPLTSDMLHEANKQYVSPAYQAIEKLPDPIKLSDTTKATIEDVRPLLPPKEAATLPAGDTITGQQAVALSKALRAKADQFPDFGVNANNQSYSSLSAAHMDAARAIEDDVKTHLTDTGREKLAEDWNAARVYRAKSGAYEQALDGAGNVQVPVLKKQLLKQGIQLSDNAELLANMGARYPKMFSSTPAAPQPGLIKKAAATAIPWATTGVGAHLGGAGGAVAGEMIGKHISDKLLRP